MRGSFIFAEKFFLAFVFSPSPDSLLSMMRSLGGKLAEEMGEVNLYLCLQSHEGEEAVYQVNFSSQESLELFLREAEKLAHIKALVEERGELPFYVSWSIRKYGGNASYDPSLDLSS